MIGQTSSASPSAGNKALVALDLDGSLMGPDTSRSGQLLRGLRRNGRIITVIDTGNEVHGLSGYGYGKALPHLRVDTLVLRNGRKIIHNPDVEGIRAPELFKIAGSLPVDETWHSTKIAAAGWEQAKPAIEGMAPGLLTEHGLGDMPLQSYARDVKLYLSGSTDLVTQRRVKGFLDAMTQLLNEQGIKVDTRVKLHGNTYHIGFNPVGVDKGTPLDYLVEKFNGVSGVVTLGNEHNDKEMLLADTFGINPQVENHPILVGNHPELSEPVRAMKNGLVTDAHQVSKAIASQVEAALKKAPRFLRHA